MKQLDLKLFTRIALFAAIILVVQQFKLQYITGPLVNTTLLFTTMIAGMPGAIFISFLSPLLALVQGIMPNAALFPFIALGNFLYCVVFFAFRRELYGTIFAPILKALVIAAGAYFVVGLPLPGAYAVGLPQLLTAILGSLLFIIIQAYLPKLNI
ncbi:MAG TPA: hypothetical protein GXZ24_02165 [Firmicutes bacterium]|nr:hypothetical protein [Bacillota bacterium]